VQVTPVLQAAVQPLHEVAVGLLANPVQLPLRREQEHVTSVDVVVATDDVVVTDNDDDTEFDTDTVNPTARPIIRQIARMPNTVVAILQNNVLLLHFRASRILFARLFSRV